MSLYNSEFTEAYDKTKKDHPALGPKIAGQRFLLRLKERANANARLPRYQRPAYGQMIRLTLNQCNIWSEDKRAAYAALVGNFYGRRGNKAKRKPVPLAQEPEPIVRTLLDRSSGQLGWEI